VCPRIGGSRNRASSRRAQVKEESFCPPTLMDGIDVQGEPTTGEDNQKYAENTKQTASKPTQIAHT
jgi:hypothetical protein